MRDAADRGQNAAFSGKLNATRDAMQRTFFKKTKHTGWETQADRGSLRESKRTQREMWRNALL